MYFNFCFEQILVTLFLKCAVWIHCCCVSMCAQFKLCTRWCTSKSAFTYVSKSVTVSESGAPRVFVCVCVCTYEWMKYVGVCGGVGWFLQALIHSRASMSRLVEDMLGPGHREWCSVTGSRKGSLRLNRSCRRRQSQKICGLLCWQ